MPTHGPAHPLSLITTSPTEPDVSLLLVGRRSAGAMIYTSDLNAVLAKHGDQWGWWNGQVFVLDQDEVSHVVSRVILDIEQEAPLKAAVVYRDQCKGNLRRSNLGTKRGRMVDWLAD